MTARLSLVFVLTLTGGFAQEAPSVTKPSPTSRTLRILPLGEAPPFRQSVENGVRIELEPDAGSIPPRKVMLGDGATAATVRLNLGRATEALKVPVGTAPVVLRIPAESADAPPKPWLTVRPPETGDLLALAWRNFGKKWDEARVLVLPDSAAAFPAGGVRVVNLLPVETAVVFGTEKVLIPPGKTLLRTIPVAEDMAIQLAYKDPAGQFQQFYAGSMLLNRNERLQVFLFAADSEKPRRPAKVIIFNEATPAAPSARP